LSQNSDPAGAANVHREILKQNPGRAEIHNNLCLVLMQMKDSKAGIAFKEALRLKPDYAEAHYNLALALL
jgi:cytochrome c-type biogenesis protein CcmH/NrfG